MQSLEIIRMKADDKIYSITSALSVSAHDAILWRHLTAKTDICVSQKLLCRPASRRPYMGAENFLCAYGIKKPDWDCLHKNVTVIFQNGSKHLKIARYGVQLFFSIIFIPCLKY